METVSISFFHVGSIMKRCILFFYAQEHRVRGNGNFCLFVFFFRFEIRKNFKCFIFLMALLSAIARPSPEDEFYTNLTLGLVKFLNGIQRITNITLNKQQPSERTQITTWEQRHNVYLADDMRRFYLSTDGFTLHWSYQYSRNAYAHKEHAR